MERKFIDLHTHTTLSDGGLSPQALIDEARRAGICTMAITDHNRLVETLKALRKANPDMELIDGCEVSCLFLDSQGQQKEIHIIALGFDPEDPELKTLLERNKVDRTEKNRTILRLLEGYGIHLGTLEEVAARFPETSYVGRMAIARTMVDMGYVSSTDEAFDIYLGGGIDQKKLAFVPEVLDFATLEEVVPVIAKTGCPVLAHLPYYSLSEADNHRLIRTFKELGGIAMEVEYRRYNRQQRDRLAEYAKQYGLLPSAASDYHSEAAGDTMANQFPMEICDGLRPWFMHK